MSQNLLKLTIARVDGPVFDGEVTAVTLPGREGEMTLMANHEALISPLRAGTIAVRTADESDNLEIAVDSGTLEISDNHATILI